ncbi:MAG: hypothetical protein WEB04_07220 [Dehalococcoidia bacterium]
MTNPLALPCARLLLDWLNTRYDASFVISDASGDAIVATDGARRAGVYVGPLWDDDALWDERLRAMELRLSGDGSFVLWVPPQANVPVDEPEAGEFVRLVQDAAATLEPGARTEVLFPRPVRLSKQREEGGYASVTGALGRWWTRITEKVQGTFSVNASAVHRITHDGEKREQLWEWIGTLSQGVSVGQAAEFDVDEAWTLQRLPADAPSGFTLIGAPPSIDPTEGIVIRRAARKRLAAANEALTALDVDLRAVALAAIYEYAELETAGAAIKALDPSFFSGAQIVAVLADGDVRPTFAPPALP